VVGWCGVGLAAGVGLGSAGGVVSTGAGVRLSLGLGDSLTVGVAEGGSDGGSEAVGVAEGGSADGSPDLDGEAGVDAGVDDADGESSSVDSGVSEARSSVEAIVGDEGVGGSAPRWGGLVDALDQASAAGTGANVRAKSAIRRAVPSPTIVGIPAPRIWGPSRRAELRWVSRS
jgi:hypothetical protein